MTRATSKSKRKTRRFYGLVFLIFLSAAAGVGLYRLSPSLLDIGRIFRQTADKIFEQTADATSAEPVLRGTVFDRGFHELAVSYRLYSLYVRPAEITDAKDVVRVLADVTGRDKDQIQNRLNEASSIIHVAEHLEQAQVDMIKNAQLPGLYVKPVEERFYPKHETAAGLVGFTGKGIGLAGVEGAFDMLLQEGAFRTDAVEGIEFEGEEPVLGRSKVDVVLTIDLSMQELVEKRLKEYLDEHPGRGIALLMDPRSGAIRAWASQPAFNPNYYWRVSDTERRSLFEESLDADLLPGFWARIAAILKNGESGYFPVPETVAAERYGLEPGEIEQVQVLAGGNRSEKCYLPSCRPQVADGRSAASPVEWAAILASLVNGGWRVPPYILGGVYDHEKEKMYVRHAGEGRKERALPPSLGVMARQDIAASFADTKDDMILIADTVEKVVTRGVYSEHVLQEAVVAALPARSPELMLFMVAERDHLLPAVRKKGSTNGAVREFGRALLAAAYGTGEMSDDSQMIAVSGIPRGHDRANYNQFLISSRIDFQERNGKGTGRVAVMPQLVGLSLRKGLQRLNEYNLQVKVQGSGQIVSQVPRPGEPLQGVGECVLTLSSEI